MRYLVAADTGGTFTDVAIHDTRSGDTRYGKALTNYDDLIEGVLAGLAATQVDVSEAKLLKHGTTHVINSLLERKGARTALVTTEGFRDILHVGRGGRPVPFDLKYRREAVLIPRSLCFEIGERIGGDGAVVRPLATDQLRELARRLRELGVDAVAVSFLNAFRNPTHEQQACAVLREELPESYICSATDLSREWMEYERTSTAVANAFVGPQMAQYIDRFEDRLTELEFPGNLYMMGSSGGVLSDEQARVRPLAMVESGPVGGCIGAAEYARSLGLAKAIAFDMGGTTAKCALIEDGEFDVQATYFVGGYEYGFPVRTPVLDIVEVGAGGGSIAALDQHGHLVVGPQSAGSTPGPIAFARGGKEPTVTDANVVLGRIGSGSFLDGQLDLDVAGAREAIDRLLAAPLGFEGPERAEHVAQGILDLAIVAMSGVIRQVTTERGRDIREYDLIAFGGGGPLFASELARDLSIRSVVVPPNPGAFSSFGMLMAKSRLEGHRTFGRVLTTSSLNEAEAEYEAMRNALLDEMSREYRPEDIGFARSMEMKYPGQGHSVTVALPPDADAKAIKAEFENAYLLRYGHANTLDPEITILRLVATAETERPQLAAGSAGSGQPGVPAAKRSVCFAGRGYVDTPIYERMSLPVGAAIVGPAIIQEYSSTTIVGVGDHVVVGDLGELRITFNRGRDPEEQEGRA